VTSVHVEVLAGGATCEGKWVLIQIRAPRDTTFPAHRPTREDVTLVIVEGAVELVLGDSRHSLSSGDHLDLPRDVPRRAYVKEDTTLLCLATPGEAEQLVDLPAEPDDVAAVLAGAGVTLLPATWGVTPA
jgi:uncharacterized cupin superfamily protein